MNLADILNHLILIRNLITVALLIPVCCSVPTNYSIFFLSVESSGDPNPMRYGLFGSSNSSQVQVGYDFSSPELDFDLRSINTGFIHSLTVALILYPVATALLGVAIMFSLFNVHIKLLLHTNYIAHLLLMIAWICSMVLFGATRSAFISQGIDAGWGNANWLALTACIVGADYKSYIEIPTEILKRVKLDDHAMSV
ncbi:pali-domain-containing protein [Lentinula edodes]|uniref:Pali-domain-containing protein n=1 Tax=Lentinula edodes TaxID=5353 RepID=A0A1Q3E5U9_LENED|nr:pali-domain-containing protein [Lentinula edodes]